MCLYNPVLCDTDISGRNNIGINDNGLYQLFVPLLNKTLA